MCSRKLGTQLAVSSTTPMRRRGNRSSTPLRIRLARATAGARYKKMESKSCSPSSCSPSRQAGMQRALEFRDVEHGRDALVAERRPHGIEVGVRQRLPVHRRRGDHGQAHALRPHPRDLLHRPAGIVQQEVRHAEEAPVTLAADLGHEAVVGPGVRPLRGTVRGQPLLPQEPVVREHDRSVQPEPVERRQAGPGEAVGVGDQVVEGRRCALPAQPAEAVLRRSGSSARGWALRAG